MTYIEAADTERYDIIAGKRRTYTLPPVGSVIASKDQESKKSCPMYVSPMDHVPPSASRTTEERTSAEESVNCMAGPMRDT